MEPPFIDDLVIFWAPILQSSLYFALLCKSPLGNSKNGPLVIDDPARLAQQPCNLAIAAVNGARRALMISDNSIAANAGWDEEMLAAELAALKEEAFDLDLLAGC